VENELYVRTTHVELFCETYNEINALKKSEVRKVKLMFEVQKLQILKTTNRNKLAKFQ